MDHIVVVGAGSGIGACIARRIACTGRSLLLHTGSNRDGLEVVARSCRDAGAEVGLCLGDLGAEKTFGGFEEWLAGIPVRTITGVVFAAGYAKLGTLSETPPEDLATAFQRMPLAFHRLVRLVEPKLAPERARIVCISAFGAHRSKSHRFMATAPAKAALEAQVRLLAAELAPRRISCNAVVPGFIEKEAGAASSLSAAQWKAVVEGIPMARLGRREDVAAVIEFLLSFEAGYLTGQSLHVDGGLLL